MIRSRRVVPRVCLSLRSIGSFDPREDGRPRPRQGLPASAVPRPQVLPFLWPCAPLDTPLEIGLGLGMHPGAWAVGTQEASRRPVCRSRQSHALALADLTPWPGLDDEADGFRLAPLPGMRQRTSDPESGMPGPGGWPDPLVPASTHDAIAGPPV